MFTVRCPECGGWGSARLGGYCKACRPPKRYKEQTDRTRDKGFIGTSFEKGYDVEQPFFPDNFIIVKEKQDLIR